MQREKGKESLRDAVKRLDERLWHQLEEVWRLAEEGIQDAQQSKDGHQQGTPHCRAVEENLAALIPDEWKGTGLVAIDLFVLSAAAALHDAGKAGDSPEDHGHVSMWEVRSRATTFGLDEGQAEVVGWIVRAHNDGDLEALPAEPIPLGTAEVDLRPVAALFKLADALHTDYRRVSRQVVESGGRRAEDSPKTRFRLRVRGWRFDDHGRIELYAVPKDWDEEVLINTGFEMTRQGLEPVAPTLQDAGFPWELTLCLDETDLEHRAILEVEAEERVERAFPGMDYFTEADASRFKGRDDDAQSLRRRVTAKPVTLLVGDSGVGKTSLIHAGLFSLLHQAQWCTIYTRPFDDPDRFIVHNLWRALPELKGEPPTDMSIVEAVARASKAMGAHKLLVVLDQFEDVVRVPLPEMLDGLRETLVAVQARRFGNLRLLVSYRADTEAALGPLFQEVAGSDRGLPRIYLQPLSRAGAEAALKVGFAEAQVGVDDRLLGTIADELETQTVAAGVYPPYVQMVGETLCQAARAETKSILTEELFRTRGSCEGIIGRYLLQRLAEFSELEEVARHVLVALVRSGGVKAQRSLDELQVESNLDVELLRQVLAELVDRRMIRHLGSERYEIVHDHLASLVGQEIMNAEEQRLKRLRELLDLKATAYVTNTVPLQTMEMAELYAVREHIAPDDKQMRLLLHSCLLGRGPAWFWLRRAQRDTCLFLLRDALACPIRLLRRNAVSIMAQVAGRGAIPDLREMLKDEVGELREAAAQALVQVAGREAIPDLRELLKDEVGWVREAAAQALVQVAGQEAIPDLREMLKHTDWNVRARAARALAQVTEREAIPDLRELLTHRDLNVRASATRALAQVAGREVIPDLREMLKDEVEEVRDAAAQALVQVTGREAIPDLRELLNHRDWRVQHAAAKALAQVGGREAIPDLRELLNHRDWRVQRAAAEALARVAGRGTIPELREMLKKGIESGWVEATWALAQVVGREAIPDLQELVKHTDWNVRARAARALAQVAGREAIPDLRELLKKDESGTVGVAAVWALARVAGREAVSDLREMLRDRAGSVRSAAAQALAQVVGREAIPDLQEMLEDEFETVRHAAALMLAQVAGRESIPDLREMLKDESENVRQAAVKTLKKLGTEEDLDWLSEWVVRHPLAETGEMANHILIHLDRKLYFPA